MGICKYQLTYIQKNALPHLTGHNMLELVDQVINPLLAKEIGFTVAKPYYKSLNFNHISFDLNGKNGSIKQDLTKQNTDALVSAGAVIFAVGSFWEPISNGFSNYPITTSIILLGSLSVLVFGIYNRTKVLKKFKQLIQWSNRRFGS